MTENLKIVCWNCHSLYTKLSEFKTRLYAETPHLVCLCETWLKESRLPSFNNYVSYFKCREARAGGGLAILVRKDVNVSEIDLGHYQQGILETQSIRVYGINQQLDILNVYNPNQTITTPELEFYISQMNSKKIIVGDFNAHHSMWDSVSRCNVSGDNLVECLLSNPDLCVLTPRDLPTYYNVPSKKFSTLDLCLISVELFPQSSLGLAEDLGSDHYPTAIEINFKPVVNAMKKRPKWIFDPKSWDKWVSELGERQHNNQSLNDSFNSFKHNIINASNTTFKKTKSISIPKYTKPWWNGDCSKVVKIRRHQKNLFHRHPTAENLLELKIAEANVKRICKLTKKQSFQKFSSTLTKDTPVKTIWNYIGRLSNKSKTIANSQPIYHQNKYVTNSKEKANSIASHYATIFNSDHHSNDENNIQLFVQEALVDDTYTDYNAEFQLHELNSAIETLKNNTPGQDEIHNLMLRNLPSDYLQWLLDIINKSFYDSVIPNEWKNALILPILKPGKPAREPSSYRPISLLSCFCKLMEKIIHSRLNFILEKQYSFSLTQGGFRKRMSTHDQIARLENTIRHSIYDRKYCVVVFFDLSQAYDGIWHLGLLYRLAKNNIKGRMLRWFREYLTDRKYSVLYEGEYSDQFAMSSGVPQGSTLSPTLFNLMLAEIPHLQFVQMAEYADDIVIFTSHKDLDRAVSLIQQQVNLLNQWFQEWGFKLNCSKTNGMIFTLRKFITPTITIDHNIISFVNQYKYLGLTFDAPRLSWAPHIKKLSEKLVC